MNGLMRLELAGVVRARWFAVAIAVSVGLVGFFLLLASRESAVIGFTGFGRVLTGVVLASLLFVPLLSVFSTAQAIPQARRDGVLEWYLSHPVSRDQTFWALLAPRFAAVATPVAGAVAVLGASAALMGQALPVDLLGRYAVLLVGQAFAFAALGILVGVTARSAEAALLRAIVLWMAAVALVDFALVGAMLQWDLPPHLVFLVGGLNPVQAARIGILAGMDADLGVLGPVGTWIATTLGPGPTLAYALGWPLTVGALAVGAARALFLRRDVL